MASPVFLYRVFVASPGGLENERDGISEALDEYSKHEALSRGVMFHPVIWEDIPPTKERPQSRLNTALRSCDFFFLLLWDRWGSPSGSMQPNRSSGTEEEFREAIACCNDSNYPMRDLAVLFKKVDARQERDPGTQLSRVLDFKKELIDSKEVFFAEFETLTQLSTRIRARLAEWMHDIQRDSSALHADPGTDTLQYSGDRISLNFSDIEVRAILQLLADFTGLNIVASDTVCGNVTVRLKNVPWDQALQVILRSKGLSMNQEGNVLLIAPTQEMVAREEAELLAKIKMRELKEMLRECSSD